MKTICKNIAFSLDGKCLLGSDCICEKNKLWLEDSAPEAQPIADKEMPEEITAWVNDFKKRHENVLVLGRREALMLGIEEASIAMYHKRQEEISSLLEKNHEMYQHYSNALLLSEGSLAAARTEVSTQAIQIAKLLAELNEAKSGPVLRPVNGDKRKPEKDYYDEPIKYLVRVKGDDPRSGWVWVGYMTLEQMQTDNMGDYWQWLEEIPADASYTSELSARQEQIAGLLASNKEWGEKYLAREKEVLDYRSALQNISDGCKTGDIQITSVREIRSRIAQLLDKYPSPTPTDSP